MIPQEKAREMVNKYLNTSIDFMYIDSQDGNCIGTDCMTHYSAVKCALIAIEEILKAIDWHEFEQPNEEYDYWNEVKQEIEKL
jgi:hypothetical protein